MARSANSRSMPPSATRVLPSPISATSATITAHFVDLEHRQHGAIREREQGFGRIAVDAVALRARGQPLAQECQLVGVAQHDQRCGQVCEALDLGQLRVGYDDADALRGAAGQAAHHRRETAGVAVPGSRPCPCSRRASRRTYYAVAQPYRWE